MSFNFSGLTNIMPSISNSLGNLRYTVNVIRGFSLKNLFNGTFPHKKSSGAKIKGYLINSETKEYEIADRAFQLALMFVQTRAIAERGRKPSGYEFGKLLEETEYDYKIEEVKDNEA